MIVSHDLSVVSMIVNASIVVKAVMALLVLASMLSWTYIFMKLFAIRRTVMRCFRNSVIRLRSASLICLG